VTDAAIPVDPQGNAKAYSVSELAFALKRTLEDRYGFVRLRGELSKVTRHSSGHCYLSLKDDKACIDGVVWKGQVRGLQVQPEQGLEVIVTGRITTYPSSSKYQIVIETMEVAGVGALLAQLERLKAKLQAEGLFEPSRKQPIPSMPTTIGVITSPTGAVIRDILHRIRDRWPCRVIVWPVVVQGEAASAQVIHAIRRFNAMGGDHPVGRPDILIVARGGGSVEDLWPFNDEALARAVAEGAIPLISAVGHETDTTLIDFVSDRRAPTPTAAAEMATPVLGELKAAVLDYERRLLRCSSRALEERRAHLTAAARGLGRPSDLLAHASQRFDNASNRLGAALARNVAVHDRQLVALTSRLSPQTFTHRLRERIDQIDKLNLRLNRSVVRVVDRAGERLVSLDKLRQAVDPNRPLARGFARVHRADGSLARSAHVLGSGESVRLVFADGDRGAVIDAAAASSPSPPMPARAAPAPRKAVKPSKAPPNQGELF
jgi:exodeoxyribonuclease VII large subunit